MICVDHGFPLDVALADFGEAGPLQLQWLTDGSTPHGGAQQALAPEVIGGMAVATALSESTGCGGNGLSESTGCGGNGLSPQTVTLDYSKNDEWAGQCPFSIFQYLAVVHGGSTHP